eukprot:GHUV01000701.1.p1 GENE.GHUV01000701.1~~GHUV01000701.1.p1  ORF type:complete len:392 (+),score=113.31 GHUV01000701.1:221-1396(+)
MKATSVVPARRACSRSSACSRPTLAERPRTIVRHRNVCRAQQDDSLADSKAVPGLLGAALAATLLWPGAGLAAEQFQTPPAQEVVSVEAPAVAQTSYQVSSDLSAAPDLVTDMDVELASHSDNPIVTGLEWMVEEGREVTNFAENNFAAVGAPTSSMWLSNSPWCLVWDAYCNVLTTRPVATKLATGMVGTFLGDLVAQFLQGVMQTHQKVTTKGGSKSSKAVASAAADAFALDFSRTARLVGFSAIVGTPVAFVWFSLLDQYVMPADPTSPIAVFAKVALDQVLMAPCMTSVFFAAMALLEGSERSEVVDLVKRKLKPTLVANWTVWPIAHVVNFALVPPAQRILYINVVNIAWTAFMSHMASSTSEEGESAKAARSAERSSKQLQQQRQ